MSHTTKLKSLVVNDVNALRSAVNELRQNGKKIELLENAKPRMYYGNQHGNCAFVVRMTDGQYDVGFDKQKDGTYAMVMDTWGGHLSGQIGAKCALPSSQEDRALHCIGQLTQSYSKHAAINAATADGFVVDSCWIDEVGDVQLLLSDLS